jgi:hypothetical protein
MSNNTVKIRVKTPRTEIEFDYSNDQTNMSNGYPLDNGKLLELIKGAVETATIADEKIKQS